MSQSQKVKGRAPHIGERKSYLLLQQRHQAAISSSVRNPCEDTINLRERDTNVEELLEGPGVDERLLKSSLRDLKRFGALLGWTHLAVRDVADIVRQRRLRAFSVLDVGTGAANVPIALARWARRRNLKTHIMASDINQKIVAEARANCADFPEIRLEQQDALALSYADQSFDLVLCQGTLHHCSAEEAQTLLQELARVARVAVIVTDLQRNLPLYLVAWLFIHTLVRNPITRQDGLASIRRAYTPAEVCALAAQVGLCSAMLRTALRFRQTLIWQR